MAETEIDVYKEWLGIPEGVRPPDYYTLLRVVQFEDDIDKIRSNYRKLNAHVRKYATGQFLVQSQMLLNELARAMLCLTDPVGKADYDASLGRETAGPDETAEPATTLDYLLAKKLIQRSQVAEIEHFASARGVSHRDAVIQMKLVEPPEATRALAAELRLPYVDLEDMLPEDDVLDRLPRRTVKKHSCLPLFEDRGQLLVACIDEPSVQLEDEIRLRFGVPMRAVLAVPRGVNQAIARYYAPGTREEAVETLASTPSKGSADPGSGKNDSARKEAARKDKAEKPARRRAGPLSDEEKSQRMQYSLIAICWSVIGTVGISYATAEQLGIFHYGLAVVIGLGVAALLRLTYWKS